MAAKKAKRKPRIPVTEVNKEVKKREPKLRIHLKNSKGLQDFLERNQKSFFIDKTSTGFPTFEYGNRQIYIRKKMSNSGALNRINQFQSQVGRSPLFKYLSQFDEEYIKKESDQIEKTLMYKGFFFNPMEEKEINGVIKIDLDTAYWQTVRYIRMIDRSLYRSTISNCTKETRLKLTGTLGKVSFRTPYEKGKKGKTFLKETTKRRIIFQNIYNRVRKFVDELMVWCWLKNPQNFVGFYVDCLWIREYDQEIISKIKEMFDIKIDMVDLKLSRNHHNKYYLSDINREDGEITPYDVKFKSNEFVSYKFFHNFNPELKGLKFKTTGWKQQVM